MLARMPTIQVRGIEIFWQEIGSGPPLLLLEGTQVAVCGWREQAPAFSQSHRVLMYDHRGTGKSSKPPGPYSTDMLADDALAVLDALSISRAHVLGYSLGGMVAQKLALRAPERADRLVLLSTFARVPRLLRPILRWRIRRGTQPDRPYSEILDEMIDLVLNPEFKAQNAAAIRSLVEMLLADNPSQEALRAQLLACIDHDTLRSLRELRRPTLVIHGTADRVVPHSWGRRLARAIPGARFESFPGGSHGILWENREEFNRLVLEFLATG